MSIWEAGALSPDSPATTSGPSAEAVLRRVELRIARRLDGMLQGERRGRAPGPGSEPGLTRGYQPGDDVRWVDWALTARTGQPMVRVPEIDPVLTGWALVDCSPSMHYGTRAQTKLSLAQEVLAGLGVVLRRRGDRLGVIATRSGGLDLVRPPRADRRGLIAAISAVRDLPPPPEGGVRTDLELAVNALGRIARHRGAVVIISDFPDSPGLERAIGGLGRRHEVIAVEVRDPREREPAEVGLIVLRDLETGRRQAVDTGDRRFRERFARVVAEADGRRAAMLSRAGARHTVIEAGSDWIGPLVEAVARPARRRLPAR